MNNPDDIIAQLTRGPSLLAGLLDSVPAGDLKRRPRPGKWSAHEHACHVAVMEPMWLTRVALILAQDNPTIISYEPAEDDPDRLLKMDLAAAMSAFARERAGLVARLEPLPPAAWERPAVHTAHTRYSLFLMCRHIAMHDAFHGYRIEEFALGSHWPNER
jgi:uncharacterized damage-inducible protein DinB